LRFPQDSGGFECDVWANRAVQELCKKQASGDLFQFGAASPRGQITNLPYADGGLALLG
jgi:hypothetical protein